VGLKVRYFIFVGTAGFHGTGRFKGRFACAFYVLKTFSFFNLKPFEQLGYLRVMSP